MTAKSPTALGLLALLACAGGPAACQRDLDTDKLERVIRDGLTERLAPDELVVASVDCPTGVAMKRGESFDCEASFQGGGKLAVHVEQKDDQGHVVYRTNQDFVAARKVESAIAAMLGDKTGVAAAVRCGARVYASVPKSTFQCSATTTTGEVLVFDVTVKDDKGNVTWTLAGE